MTEAKDGSPDSADDLKIVLTTTDPALLPIVRSVLEAAEIPFIVQGEAGMTVFPLGDLASRVTGRITGTSVLVREQDFEEASALLSTPTEFEFDPDSQSE